MGTQMLFSRWEQEHTHTRNSRELTGGEVNGIRFGGRWGLIIKLRAIQKRWLWVVEL